jgi:hypothetical protein
VLLALALSTFNFNIGGRLQVQHLKQKSSFIEIMAVNSTVECVSSGSLWLKNDIFYQV